MRKNLVLFCLLTMSLLQAHGAQVGSEFANSACEEFQLARELIIYKDPSLFIGSLGQMYNDPHQGWSELMSETPVLTSLQGTVYLMKLGEPTEFKNFGVISKLYELVEPRLKSHSEDKKSKASQALKSERPWVIPVKVCGASYGDSLGFVLVSDLKWAQHEERESGALPPSIYPNPVPNLKRP
jgi:hypothetical protein